MRASIAFALALAACSTPVEDEGEGEPDAGPSMWICTASQGCPQSGPSPLVDAGSRCGLSADELGAQACAETVDAGLCAPEVRSDCTPACARDEAVDGCSISD